MHELGIVFHIIDTVEQVGRDNGVTQVRSEDKMKSILPYMLKREIKIRFNKE